MARIIEIKRIVFSQKLSCEVLVSQGEDKSKNKIRGVGKEIKLR